MNDNVAVLDTRKATVFLNYKGNVVDSIMERKRSRMPFGPTTVGEPVWPLGAAYDAQMDVTRVGCSFLPPPLPPT